MDVRSAVKVMLKRCHCTQRMYCERNGLGFAAVSNTLGRGSNFDFLLKVVKDMGYEIVLQPRGHGGRRSDDQILLDCARSEKGNESEV